MARSVGVHRRGARKSPAVVAALVLSILGAGVAEAAIPLDFGTVSVGSVRTLSATVPLQASLSQIPPQTIIYSGGNPSIDLALSLAGLSVPLTAGALYGVTGEVTATYHLSASLVTGTDFSVDATACGSGTGSCSASITFAPTAAGVRTDTVNWTSSDLQISGGGTFGSLIQLVAPFLAASFESQLAIDLSGIGVPTRGSVAAQVSIAASAACVQLSTDTIDFGNLSLGAENAPASPSVTVTNCSGVGETLFASGTDADGTSSHWSLVDSSATCADTLGIDNYRMRLASASLAGPLSLSTDSKLVQALGAAGSAEHTASIFTACPGSTGAGRVMTMFVNYVVVGD